MAYLANFDPPPLRGIQSSLRKKYESSLIFLEKQLPASPAAVRLLSVYVIVVDKASREYRAGCDAIARHTAGNQPTELFMVGVGHFENCLNASRRALGLLGRLGSQPEAPTAERHTRKLAQSWSKQVVDVRDAIEHIDGDITSQGLTEGSAHLLTITNDGERLEIGQLSLPLGALATTISSLHQAGVEMLQALPFAQQPDA